MGRLLRLLMYVLLVGWAAVQLYPLVFLFASALKTPPEIVGQPWALPTTLHFENFVNAWQGGTIGVPIGRYFINSVIVTGGSLLVLTIAGTLGGYALARFHFPGEGIIYRFFIWTISVPVAATLIPVFVFLGNLGLRNNYLGLIGLYAAFWMPFTVIVMRSYFLSFPRELEEAGLIDGCSELGVFARIVAPIARGAIASVTVVNMVGIYSELLFAFLIMNKPELKTLPAGILAFRGEYSVEWSLLFAGLAISTIPMLVFYLVFQRQITRGMTLGAFR